MRATLSAPIQTPPVQKSFRLLLTILDMQPRVYRIGVFYEMSVNGSPRALAGLLMRMLEVGLLPHVISERVPGAVGLHLHTISVMTAYVTV